MLATSPQTRGPFGSPKRPSRALLVRALQVGPGALDSGGGFDTSTQIFVRPGNVPPCSAAQYAPKRPQMKDLEGAGDRCSKNLLDARSRSSQKKPSQQDVCHRCGGCSLSSRLLVPGDTRVHRRSPGPRPHPPGPRGSSGPEGALVGPNRNLSGAKGLLSGAKDPGARGGAALTFLRSGLGEAPAGAGRVSELAICIHDLYRRHGPIADPV